MCKHFCSQLENEEKQLKMSFKREGDDHDLLNRLKHQRVTGLLGNFIPEEEAKLLSNGRFTCLVCVHRPIFDTIQMLSIHRKGKKHLQELSKYIKRKSELEFEAIKKEHQSSLNLENENDLTAELRVVNSSILSPKELVSGKFKRRFNENIRRKTLELPTFINEVQIMATNLKEGVHGPSSASQVRHYLKQLPRKLSLEKIVERERRYSVSHPKPEEKSKQTSSSEKTIPEMKPNLKPSPDLSVHLSGWKKDKFGNWVKDPEAEFDSDDEDQPDKLPT